MRFFNIIILSLVASLQVSDTSVISTRHRSHKPTGRNKLSETAHFDRAITSFRGNFDFPPENRHLNGEYQRVYENKKSHSDQNPSRNSQVRITILLDVLKRTITELMKLAVDRVEQSLLYLSGNRSLARTLLNSTVTDSRPHVVTQVKNGILPVIKTADVPSENTEMSQPKARDGNEGNSPVNQSNAVDKGPEKSIMEESHVTGPTEENLEKKIIAQRSDAAPTESNNNATIYSAQVNNGSNLTNGKDGHIRLKPKKQEVTEHARVNDGSQLAVDKDGKSTPTSLEDNDGSQLMDVRDGQITQPSVGQEIKEHTLANNGNSENGDIHTPTKSVRLKVKEQVIDNNGSQSTAGKNGRIPPKSVGLQVKEHAMVNNGSHLMNDKAEQISLSSVEQKVKEHTLKNNGSSLIHIIDNKGSQLTDVNGGHIASKTSELNTSPQNSLNTQNEAEGNIKKIIDDTAENVSWSVDETASPEDDMVSLSNEQPNNNQFNTESDDFDTINSKGRSLVHYYDKNLLEVSQDYAQKDSLVFQRLLERAKEKIALCLDDSMRYEVLPKVDQFLNNLVAIFLASTFGSGEIYFDVRPLNDEMTSVTGVLGNGGKECLNAILEDDIAKQLHQFIRRQDA